MKTESSKIKILICDDLQNIIDYFSMIIQSDPALELVGTAHSANEAIALSEAKSPDIVLMDIQMENGEAGILATKQIKEKNPKIKVIIVTVHEEDALLFKAFSAGAEDYIIKTQPQETILQSIHDVYHNQLALRPEIAAKLREEFIRLQKKQSSLMYTINLVSHLTNAEFEILRMLYAGMSRREISKKRFVELTTINTQVAKILSKMECNSTKELLRTLKELNIFTYIDQIPK